MRNATARAAAGRRLAGRMAGALFAACLLCVADGLLAAWLAPFNAFSAVAGSSFALNGPLPKGAPDLARVRVEGPPPGVLRISLEKTYKGFWFGGLMWKGTVSVSPRALPGAYFLTVRGPGSEAPSPLLRFRIGVYSDSRALRRASHSICVRLLGLRPFALAGALLLPLMAAVGFTFFEARRLTRLYRAEGKAEIFHVSRTPEGIIAHFELGTANGAREGMEMLIRREDGSLVARGLILTVKPCESTALVTGDAAGVRPGLVADIRPE